MPNTRLSSIINLRYVSDKANETSSNNVFEDPQDSIPQTQIDSICSEETSSLIEETLPICLSISTATSLSEISFFKIPSYLIRNFVEHLHDDISLPWWAAMIGSTVLIRLFYFGIQSFSEKSLRWNDYYENHIKGMSKIIQQMKSQQEKIRALKGLKAFKASKKIRVFRAMAINLSVIPIFFSNFWATKALTLNENLKTGGVWFFTDLTTHDPYLILPVVFAVCTSISIKIFINRFINRSNFDWVDKETLVKFKPLIVVTFGFLSGIISSRDFLNAGMMLYLISNSVLANFLMYLNQTDIIRKLRGLPTEKDIAEFNKTKNISQETLKNLLMPIESTEKDLIKEAIVKSIYEKRDKVKK